MFGIFRNAVFAAGLIGVLTSGVAHAQVNAQAGGIIIGGNNGYWGPTNGYGGYYGGHGVGPYQSFYTGGYPAFYGAELYPASPYYGSWYGPGYAPVRSYYAPSYYPYAVRSYGIIYGGSYQSYYRKY